MMHILIKLHHEVKSYEQFHSLTTTEGQTDRWTRTAIKVHTCGRAILFRFSKHALHALMRVK